MLTEKSLLKTNEFFGDKLQKLGANSLGVGWNGDDAQRVRYEQLTKLIDFNDGRTICDFGCGYGYYLSYLQEVFPDWRGKYTGYDISENMIQAAKKIYGQDDENHNFVVGTKLANTFDYIIESGIFNLKFDIPEDEWKSYILETLQMFDKYSAKGFAFNALTKYSDKEKMRNDLYYSDPLFLFDYCKRNFSRNVALLHDYELYDFTIIVRK